MGRESNNSNAFVGRDGWEHDGSNHNSWTVHNFDLFDPTALWAPAVSRELGDRWPPRPGVPDVSGWTNSKQFHTGADLRISQGLILFFDGSEKECLSILSRLMDDPHECPMAAVLNSHHSNLVPVLLESNVTSIMMEPVNDVPIADWCMAMFDLAHSKAKSSRRRES